MAIKPIVRPAPASPHLPASTSPTLVEYIKSVQHWCRDVQQTLTQVLSQLKTLDSVTSKADGVAQAPTNIATLQGQASSLQTQVTSNTSNISTNTTNLAALQSQVNGIRLMPVRFNGTVFTSGNDIYMAKTDFVVFMQGSGPPSCYLPDATQCAGYWYVIVQQTSNSSVVRTISSQTLGASGTSYTLSAKGNSCAVISDGTQWWFLSKN